MKMGSERYHPLTFQLKRHGAESVGAFDRHAAIIVAPRLHPVVAAAFSGFALSRSVGAASIGSQLRSSLHRRVRAALPRAAHRSVAARSDNTGLSQTRIARVASWPNNSLVPTPVTNALSLRVGSGAAQLKRWA